MIEVYRKDVCASYLFFSTKNKESENAPYMFFLDVLMLKGGLPKLFFFPTWKKYFAGREEK